MILFDLNLLNLTVNYRRKKVTQLMQLEREKHEKLESLPELNREKIIECTEQQAK